MIAAVRARPGAVPPTVADEVDASEPAYRALLERLDFWPTHALWAVLFDAELATVDHGSGADVPGTDASAWRRAVEAAAAPEAPGFLAPYALLRQGEAELADADRAGARVTLQQALDLAEAGGVGAVRERIERVASTAAIALDGAARAHTPEAAGIAGAATSDADSLAIAELTARERQVLDLIAEGLSNRQIGERLFISAKTASVHVSAILRKLGAATRTEAAYRAGALR